MKSFEYARHILVGFALMVAGDAFGQGKDPVLWTPRYLMSGEAPMPDRVARADIVALGRVVAIEAKQVEAILSAGQPFKVDFRIAVVHVNQLILGPKGIKEFRVGFVSPEQDKNMDKTGKAMPRLSALELREVKLGEEGLFFVKKHHQDDFYVNFVFFSGFVPRDDTAEFAKQVEHAMRLGKVLEKPVDALKDANAINRFVAANMLISRYRLSGVKAPKLPEKAIEADESKLLLKVLADADWQDVNEAISSSRYPPHPYRVFLQLGATKKDGYDPPQNVTDIRQTLAYAQRWLVQHQQTYRVQRFETGAK